MKVSIIMVCYNAGNEIERTLSSIFMQNIEKEDMELLIIDGASTDNTKNIVTKYITLAKEQGYNLRFYSEPDNGIYDAMNKGAKLAEGEWCIYMNAGDRFFHKDSLNYLLNEADNSYGFLYGDTIFEMPIKSSKRYALNYAPKENECNFINSKPFCHQSSMVKTKLLKDNLFSTKYKICGDHDFFARICQQGVKFHYVKHFISVFSCDGISSNNIFLTQKESADIALDNGFISRDEYNNKILSYKRNNFIKKLIPKGILKFRRKIFHLDPLLYTWEEIMERYG